jgi:hypothetical protein
MCPLEGPLYVYGGGESAVSYAILKLTFVALVFMGPREDKLE